MQKSLPIWQFIHQNLQQKIAVMLLYVLESKGSSPGRQGFSMSVNAEGEMIGSMGGGIMEHKFIEVAKSKLAQSSKEISMHQQVHDKAAKKNQSGMICSGEQTILLYTVQPNDELAIESLVQSLAQNKNGCLRLSKKGIEFSVDAPALDFQFNKIDENNFHYIEKTGFKHQLFIIGGGHCALAFSRLMSTMDFYIHLIDERQVLNTIEQNIFAHQKTVVNNFEEITNLVTSGTNTHVVIMTFGYRTDEIATRALLGKVFKYFGILGSKSKMKKMFQDLIASGISSDILNNIHTPIGLPIQSQTPEEIAVSIAAQIIQIKNT